MWCQIISSSSQTPLSPCDYFLPVSRGSHNIRYPLYHVASYCCHINLAQKPGIKSGQIRYSSRKVVAWGWGQQSQPASEVERKERGEKAFYERTSSLEYMCAAVCAHLCTRRVLGGSLSVVREIVANSVLNKLGGKLAAVWLRSIHIALQIHRTDQKWGILIMENCAMVLPPHEWAVNLSVVLFLSA